LSPEERPAFNKSRNSASDSAMRILIMSFSFL
jgi:hypothetical protein